MWLIARGPVSAPIVGLEPVTISFAAKPEIRLSIEKLVRPA